MDSPYLRLLRPHHWIKNGLILIVLVFSNAWRQPQAWFQAVMALVAFCGLASAGYIVNDLMDVKEDRRHPTKKNRPIASGRISVRRAYAMAASLFLMSLLIGSFLDPSVSLALLAYAALMYGYSRGLKRVPLLDLLIIALGFVIRILVGGLAIAVSISVWLIMCTFVVALLLGLGKRIVEGERVGDRGTRKTLQFYTRQRTLWMERVLSVLTICLYLAYTLSGKHSLWMVVSVIPVIFGVYRYSFLLTHTQAEGPTELLVKDCPLQIALASWMAIVVLVLAV